MPKPLNGNGPRIMVFRFNYSTSKYCIDDVAHFGIAMHELMIATDPYACISGLVYITDLSQASANHFLQVTPNFCKKVVSFWERSMPLRIKSLYYINTSPPAQQFFKILFPLFSEKIRKRVWCIHQNNAIFLKPTFAFQIHIMGHDLTELHRDISLQYLPQDFGGELPSLEELTAEDDSKLWDDNKDFFKANANYGTDESLRPGKPLDIDGLFGVGGSFRKLNVD